MNNNDETIDLPSNWNVPPLSHQAPFANVPEYLRQETASILVTSKPKLSPRFLFYLTLLTIYFELFVSRLDTVCR